MEIDTIQADIEEAFRYNSCKKIAQLCRVALELRDERIDHFFQLKSVKLKGEERIKKIEKNEIRMCEDQQDELIQYRKDCIDNYCVDYGALYKQLKQEYAQLIDSKRQQMVDISHQIKEQKKKMVSIEKHSLKTAAELLDSTEFETKELESLRGKQQILSRKELNEFEKQFRLKCQDLEKDSNGNLMRISELYSQEARNMRKEIKQKIKNIILERKDIFMGYKQQLEELKGDVNGLKAEHRQVMEKRASLTITIGRYKKRVNEELKEFMKNKQMEMRDMQKQSHNENRDIESEIFAVQRKIRVNNTNFDKKIAALDSQISRQRTQTHQLKSKMKMDKREKKQAANVIKREASSTAIAASATSARKILFFMFSTYAVANAAHGFNHRTGRT